MDLNTLEDIRKVIKSNSRTNDEKLEMQLNKIISRLPKTIGDLIHEGFEKQRIPKEYLLTSILFAYSSAIGLSINIKSLGYTNYGNLYFALIGKRGSAKSPAMDLATAALTDHDSYYYNEYKNEMKIAAINGEADTSSIIRKRILLQNATIESVLKAHHENPYSIGLFKDEGFAFFDNMRNNSSSRDGIEWREFLLQGNTNKHADITRRTSESFRTNKTCPTLLVSVQTEFMKNILSGGILESGMVDRFLFCANFTRNNKLSSDVICDNLISNYNNSLNRILDLRRDYYANSDEVIKPITIKCNPDAENMLHDYVQNLIYKQNDANDLNHGHLAKMQINIHKIIVLIHGMENLTETNELRTDVCLSTVKTAIDICNFYYENFKVLTNFEQQGFSKQEENKIIKVGLKNCASMEEIARIIGVNKSTISRRAKSLK
jgi:hypothetical protein